MAISMVRQPSETPNVTNIDDIIPFRYAYGDQNGYVIGKGQELSYTINGRDFRVNSGRVVLNGVESDVDANGVTFTIDNASETRYYVVYYQVNLATNTTDILLSNFSTTGYPVIDIGDDLTTNPSGLARMELYRFTTSNGVIGNVEKIVKAIEYSGTALVGYDISKGTVEERLDALGFREGSVDLSMSVSTTLNEVKRQGNYVIGNITFSNDISVDSLRQTIGVVPEEFRPKQAEYIYVDCSVRAMHSASAGHIGAWISIRVQGTISTNGEIIVYTSSATSGNAILDMRATIKKILFAYEANPIE